MLLSLWDIQWDLLRHSLTSLSRNRKHRQSRFMKVFLN
jgi:hypothetical protein